MVLIGSQVKEIKILQVRLQNGLRQMWGALQIR